MTWKCSRSWTALVLLVITVKEKRSTCGVERKTKLGYGTSYLNLHPYVHRQGGEGDMVVLQPYEYHPNTSELVRLLKKGHHNVKLTDKEWKTLYNWIDYNAPDKGYFNANVLTDLPYRDSTGSSVVKLTDKYANGAGVDWKKEIADYADYLKKQGPITPVMPEKAAPVKEKTLKVKGWPFGADRIKEMLAKEKETRKVVEIAPGVKVNFVRIPAGEFVMGSYRGEPDAYPTAKVKIDKAFGWPSWKRRTNSSTLSSRITTAVSSISSGKTTWFRDIRPINRNSLLSVSATTMLWNFCRKLSEKTGSRSRFRQKHSGSGLAAPVATRTFGMATCMRTSARRTMGGQDNAVVCRLRCRPAADGEDQPVVQVLYLPSERRERGRR